MSIKYKHLQELDKEDTFQLFKTIFHTSEHCYFEETWKNRKISSSLGLYRDYILIGFTLVIKNELKYIAVKKSLQVEGIGTALLKETIHKTLKGKVKSLILYPADSDYLVNWYISNGFSIDINNNENNHVKLIYNKSNHSFPVH